MLSGWYEYDYADHNFLLFRPHIIVYIILVNKTILRIVERGIYPGRSVVKAVAVAQTELPPAARTFVKQVSRRYRGLFDQ